MPPRKKGRAGKPRGKVATSPESTPAKQRKTVKTWKVPSGKEDMDFHDEGGFQNGDPLPAKSLYMTKAKELVNRYSYAHTGVRTKSSPLI